MSDINIHVPATVAEMKPLKSADLITEAAGFLRTHWDEVKPYFKAISGEEPSIHGSLPMDEAAMVFEVQEIAKSNGYQLLGTVKAATLRLALRRGFARNTGIQMHQLESQNRQLRLEFRKAEKTETPKGQTDIS